MPVKNKQIQILLSLAALLAGVLACNMPRRGGSITVVENTPIPVSIEAVATLQNNLEQAATQAALNREVSLQVTEEQLTSLVATQLEKEGDERLQNPQILLRNGQIELQADVQESGVSMPLVVALTVGVDANGQPTYQVASASLGPLPLPDSMLEELSTRLDSTLSARVLPETENLVIENITIADGVMTITGYTR